MHWSLRWPWLAGLAGLFFGPSCQTTIFCTTIQRVTQCPALISHHKGIKQTRKVPKILKIKSIMWRLTKCIAVSRIVQRKTMRSAISSPHRCTSKLNISVPFLDGVNKQREMFWQIQTLQTKSGKFVTFHCISMSTDFCKGGRVELCQYCNCAPPRPPNSILAAFYNQPRVKQFFGQNHCCAVKLSAFLLCSDLFECTLFDTVEHRFASRSICIWHCIYLHCAVFIALYLHRFASRWFYI